MKKLIVAIGLLGLGGCSLLQGAYDSEAREACRDLPTVEERVACERSTSDAERDRRFEDLNSKE